MSRVNDIAEIIYDVFAQAYLRADVVPFGAALLEPIT